MIRLLYNLLFPIGLLFFLPGYVLKMRRRGNYRRNFGQRFAHYSEETRARLQRNSSTTWVHAVSVGEVGIALKLAAKLRSLDSAFTCVLTTTTTTGYAFAESSAAEWIQVLYNPIDFWPIVRRAFSIIKPIRLILIEAEVWPNLAAEAKRRRTPLSLVNARLSARSERRFRRFLPFVRPTFRQLDLVCVQEPEDLERWAALGVSPAAIEVVGSVKYDPEELAPDAIRPLEILQTLGVEANRPILLAGSTHAGEEEILAQVFLQLRAELPSLFLIIAPRHVERAREIRETLEKLGLRKEDWLLIDTTGQLRSWYSVATAVFIGKSLGAHGGQNPVEPILAGKPVVFGPHMENFAVLTQSLLSHHAAIQIYNRESLRQAMKTLLLEVGAREKLVANAERVLVRHRGATERTARLVLTRKSLATPR